jgi:hypothetical protein
MKKFSQHKPSVNKNIKTGELYRSNRINDNGYFNFLKISDITLNENGSGYTLILEVYEGDQYLYTTTMTNLEVDKSNLFKMYSKYNTTHSSKVDVYETEYNSDNQDTQETQESDAMFTDVVRDIVVDRLELAGFHIAENTVRCIVGVNGSKQIKVTPNEITYLLSDGSKCVAAFDVAFNIPEDFDMFVNYSGKFDELGFDKLEDETYANIEESEIYPVMDGHLDGRALDGFDPGVHKLLSIISGNDKILLRISDLCFCEGKLICTYSNNERAVRIALDYYNPIVL